mgnify:CR=1 FL=1
MIIDSSSRRNLELVETAGTLTAVQPSFWSSPCTLVDSSGEPVRELDRGFRLTAAHCWQDQTWLVMEGPDGAQTLTTENGDVCLPGFYTEILDVDLGCALVLLMLALIIARCIWVGVRCQDYIRRLVCFGAASALIFQVMINIGMCIGVMPVIGLTLPLISYGGSSVVTIFAMLGLVSGSYARPESLSHERYIQPYR